MADDSWPAQLAYLEALRDQGRLYRGYVIPAVIPKGWPDDTYSGPARLTPTQVDRPGPPAPPP